MRRSALLATAAAMALLSYAPRAMAQVDPQASDQRNVVVITAERREGELQTTPVAVTAIGSEDLSAQRIDSGANLAAVVPNMSFQPGLFGRPNFSIRGIGYQLVTTTGEAGVAVHLNDTPQTASRLAKSEFYDIERIEVLRGPQGTLFGRNATGGVVNVITAKPDDTYAASFTAEGGDFGRTRMTGYVNIPLAEGYAVRIAGNRTKTDGFQYNVFNNHQVNGLDLDSERITFGFKPTSQLDGHFLYERFHENDNGGSGGGNLTNACLRDPGPTSVGGVSLTDGNANNTAIRNYLSFGCGHASIYDANVVGGVLNGVGTFGNRLAVVSGYASGDLFANNRGLADQYEVNIDDDPTNSTSNDFFQLALNYKLSDALTLSSITSYDRDHLTTGSGGLRSQIQFAAFPGFPVASPQILDGTPLSYYTSGGYSDLYTEEKSQEVRLTSDYGGAFDFSAGAIYVDLKRVDNVYVFDNSNTYYGTVLTASTPIDPNPRESADGGHYYFQSHNPYRLKSAAAFGEVYWKPVEKVSVTGGLRYTQDEKVFGANNSGALLLAPGSGYTFAAPQEVTFKETTGRVSADWQPELPFTDRSLFYATYSRGYKGGGFNPPNLPGIPEAYRPEFVNSIEVGAKNELAGRSLTLNLTGFHYDYKDYQFTQAAVFGTLTSNVDAVIQGIELETTWRPIDDLVLNAQIGVQDTEIEDGPTATSIDQYNPTQGRANYFALKTLLNYCVVNETNLGALITQIKAGNVPVAALFSGCPASAAADPAGLFVGVGAGDVAGVSTSIAGNRLPMIPSRTIAIGAQYTFRLSDWELTARADHRYQGDQFTDLFNNEDQHVRSYGTTNITLTLANNDGVTIQAFGKNLGSKGEIIGAAPGGGAITASQRTVVVIDPPTWGVSLRKDF